MSEPKSKRGSRPEDHIAALNRELADLRRIVARVEPETIAKSVTPTVASYSPALCESVIALGRTGKFASEIRAELGITGSRWREWSTAHEAFRMSIERARDLAKAFWHESLRTGLINQSWKVPYAATLQMIDRLAHDPESEAAEAGDAASLVKIDATVCAKCQPCPECLRLRGENVEAEDETGPDDQDGD